MRLGISGLLLSEITVPVAVERECISPEHSLTRTYRYHSFEALQIYGTSSKIHQTPRLFQTEQTSKNTKSAVKDTSFGRGPRYC